MSKYKVVLVLFPFDDLSSSKVRPAVCLTGPMGSYHHIVVAFVTSRLPEEPMSSDVMLNIEDADFVLTGLHVSSTLRLHRMLTVTVDLIRRELGQLSPMYQQQVRDKLRTLFELE